MILMVCALMPEAKPLIAHFNLKKDFTVKEHEYFRSDEAELIVSGVGKVKSAVATTAMLLRQPERTAVCIANIGICGSIQPRAPGEMFLINKIHDAAVGKSYFPDMLLQHDLHEASLATFETAVKRETLLNPDSELVDMEAAGFIQAAQLYLFPHQIVCLKVVSDSLEGATLSADFAAQLITSHCGKIAGALMSLEQFVLAKAGDEARA